MKHLSPLRPDDLGGAKRTAICISNTAPSPRRLEAAQRPLLQSMTPGFRLARRAESCDTRDQIGRQHSSWALMSRQRLHTSAMESSDP